MIRFLNTSVLKNDGDLTGIALLPEDITTKSDGCMALLGAGELILTLNSLVDFRLQIDWNSLVVITANDSIMIQLQLFPKQLFMP